MCPSRLQSRRKRLFPSKSVQQRGQGGVTRGLLVLQAGNKPCCPCPGLLSCPWVCKRHTAVPCRCYLAPSTGAAVSAGQTGLAGRGGSVHVLQLWLSCAALAAQTAHFPCSITSQGRTLPCSSGVLGAVPSQPWRRAGRGMVSPGNCRLGQWCGGTGRGRSPASNPQL